MKSFLDFEGMCQYKNMTHQLVFVSVFVMEDQRSTTVSLTSISHILGVRREGAEHPAGDPVLLILEVSPAGGGRDHLYISLPQLKYNV